MAGMAWWGIVLAWAVSSAAHAADPDTTPVPASVRALTGCWEGRGEVRGKAVAIALTAYPIVQDAMLAVEAASSTIADPADRYQAHLVFGGAKLPPGTAMAPVVGYWADSFGGASAAVGQGASRADGFDITYRYPDAAFVNRWRMAGDTLTWRIAARGGTGTETSFASYALHRTACEGAPPPR